MTVWYKVLYQITPWEENPLQGPAADQMSTLFEREEEDRQQAHRQRLTWAAGAVPGP